MSDQAMHHAHCETVGVPPGHLVAPPGSPAPRLTVLAYSADNVFEQADVDLSSLAGVMDQWPVVWVNVDGLGDTEKLQFIGQTLGLHPLALEDVVSLGQRAKVEQYGRQLFLVTHMVSINRRIETEQLSIFLGEGFVLTFQERPGDCLEPVRQRIRDCRGRIRQAGADYLAYAILDAVIDHYFPALEEIGERLEALETDALEARSTVVLQKIRRSKRDLLVLRRTLWPQRDALASLQRDEHDLITPETQLYMRDGYDHVTRLIETIEGHREQASDLSNVYMTALSNRMNAVMKVLTIIATIFIPLTFIAGVYGMNFKHMPELGWRWSYPAALAVMAAVALGMIVFFRRRRWL